MRRRLGSIAVITDKNGITELRGITGITGITVTVPKSDAALIANAAQGAMTISTA
jgi:hypothetical protein